jgi:hypothetical protein
MHSPTGSATTPLSRSRPQAVRWSPDSDSESDTVDLRPALAGPSRGRLCESLGANVCGLGARGGEWIVRVVSYSVLVRVQMSYRDGPGSARWFRHLRWRRSHLKSRQRLVTVSYNVRTTRNHQVLF